MRDILVEVTDSLCTKMTQMNGKILTSVTEKLIENFIGTIELMTDLSKYDNEGVEIIERLFPKCVSPTNAKIRRHGDKRAMT